MEQMNCGLHEFKFAQEGDVMTFEGYGAVFNNVDFGGDLIEPGAFGSTLAQHKAAGTMPTMYYEHGVRGGGPPMPVGIWEDMAEDGHGLRVKGRLLPTTLGNDLYILLKGNAVKGLSIGYKVTDAAPRIRPDDPKRRIKSAALVEVSLVNDPMNPRARVSQIKSADEIVTIRDLEESLRDLGVPKSEALAICARFEAKADRRDSGADEAIVTGLDRFLSKIRA